MAPKSKDKISNNIIVNKCVFLVDMDEEEAESKDLISDLCPKGIYNGIVWISNRIGYCYNCQTVDGN